jgi:hypothetical protein
LTPALLPGMRGHDPRWNSCERSSAALPPARPPPRRHQRLDQLRDRRVLHKSSAISTRHVTHPFHASSYHRRLPPSRFVRTGLQTIPSRAPRRHARMPAAPPDAGAPYGKGVQGRCPAGVRD